MFFFNFQSIAIQLPSIIFRFMNIFLKVAAEYKGSDNCSVFIGTQKD